MVNSITGEVKIHTNLKILEIYDNFQSGENVESIYQFKDKLNNLYIVLNTNAKLIFIEFETNQFVHYIDSNFKGMYNFRKLIPIDDLEIAILIENHNNLIVYDLSEL
jgi:hypothetical protein